MQVPKRAGLAAFTLPILILTSCGDGGSDSAVNSGPFDLIVRNATVLDGTGSPGFDADIGIMGDRITSLGDLEDATASREIDASGLVVAPGFIDVHSHSGGSLTDAERSPATPLLFQGLTTVVVNPDGGGPVDLVAQRAALLNDGLGVNVIQLIPHGSVRSAVLGSEDRAPTPAELDEMRVLVRAGMEAGGFGLSSGPFYAPGSFSDTEELVELSRTAAEFGGVYTSHIRDESDYTIGLIAAVEEVITVAEESGLKGIVTHIKALGPPVWGLAPTVVDLIDDARERGVEVFADQYPYEASSTGLSAALLPRWAQAGGNDSLRARFADPDVRSQIRAEMVQNLVRRGGADRIQIQRYPPEPEQSGKFLSEIAESWDLDPIDAALRILEQASPSITSFNMSDDDIATFMAQPWTMTSSDGSLPRWEVGLPHPRAYGSFPRKLGRFVREQGVISLEQAVRSMTGLSADVFGLDDRGLIEEGRIADLVIFSADEIIDQATYAEPHQLSTGVRYLLVNGVLAIDGGEATGEMAGQVLRPDGR